jgi:putative endonuclease
MSGCWFYILQCADGSYYAGSSRSQDMETRIGHHNQGYFGGSTTKRRPVTLVYSSHFDSIADAIAYESQVKGWSRAKKESSIRGDFGDLQGSSKSYRLRRKSANTSDEIETRN